MASDTIFVVDDEENVRDMLTRFLSGQGHRVISADSGEEALPHLDQAEVDLIITDFKMPGMDGLALAEKALMANPDRPVILMTAYADVNNARRSVTLGVYDFIIKPFDLADFGAAVRRALSHRRLVAQNRAYQSSLERMVEERTQALREALTTLSRKVKELEGRDRINQLLVTVQAQEESLCGVLEAVQNAVGAERVILFLSEANGQRLEPAIGTGVFAPDDLTSPSALRGVSEAWLEDARARALRAFRESRVVRGEEGGVAVPLVRLGEALGALFAQNPFSGRPLSDEEVQTLESLAAPAAVALSDARLFGDSEQWKAAMEGLERLSSVDRDP